MTAWLERRLGPRLLAVAAQVEGEVVCDVGSDHGLLPAYLLRSGRCRRVICVEKNPGPYERCLQALRGVSAEVLLGDGLVYEEPVDCLTLCGFGSRSIASVLSRGRERVPSRVVVQPHRDPTPLLRWASSEGFSVERHGSERFPVFVLQQG